MLTRVFSTPRADLNDPRDITVLMAQDLNEIRRECGSVTQPQLLDRGWTARQVKEHFLHALEEAFRTYTETAATTQEAAQAAPFLEFDREMSEQLARIETPLRERSAHHDAVGAELRAISPLGPDEAAFAPQAVGACQSGGE